MRAHIHASSIYQHRWGLWVTIVLSAITHLVFFAVAGKYNEEEKDEVVFFSPPYSVRLMTGADLGEEGEGATEEPSEAVDVTRPLESGGAETVGLTAVNPAEEAKKSPIETKKESITEGEKESTKDLASAIENIRKKVELEEEKKILEAEKHEKEIKEKLKDDVAKTTKTDGSPSGKSPEGRETPLAGKTGGGSPFGSDTVFASGGSGMGLSDNELLEYYDRVWKQIRAMWFVPDDLLEQDLVTVMGIRIARDGRILDMWMESSSGNEFFDETTITAMKKASPLPPLPGAYTGGSLDLGIRFHSKRF